MASCNRGPGEGFLKALTLVLLLFAACDPGEGPGEPRPEEAIDPGRYPVIGTEEMGQFRWVLQIANQPIEDFTHLEALNQNDLTSYRYAIAFSTYFLAVEQYHKLPAWSEAIRPAMERLIRKILQKPVWEYWAKTSRGIPTLEPRMDRPYPSSHDPVAEKNIMYAGHLGHMINLYEMLYRDFSWDQPGSIVFAWSETEKYVYDNHSLERVMHDQMTHNPYHAITCEPNACFSECNQHPVLSFLLYDHTHGTRLSEAGELFFSHFMTGKGMFHPDRHETAMLYLAKQDSTLSETNPYYGNLVDLVVPPAIKAGLVTLDSATANGWTGAFMHAWKPETIEEHYPFWKERHVIDKGDGTAEIKMETWEPLVRVGFFALLAAELGDAETRDRLLAHAHRAYAPVWQGGTLHYPFNLLLGCTNLTDKLLALARATPRNGLRLLHGEPFGEDHFLQPEVGGVDFPALLLRRAVYDPQRRALVVTTDVAVPAAGTSRFEMRRLDPARSYSLLLDGRKQRSVRQATGISVDAPLDGPHHFVLRED